MKKTTHLLLLLTLIKSTHAATGSRSDDYVVLVVPSIFLVLLWVGYKIKSMIAARKQRMTEASTSGEPLHG
jgi:hypothetical protein